MSDLMKTLALAGLLALAPLAPALAQTPTPVETPAEPPAQPPAADGVSDNGLTLGEEVDEVDGAPSDGVGSTYIQSEHGDWQIRCVRAPDGKDPCQMYQLLADAEGNSVAEISMFGLPKGQQAAAGATVITPLETLLTAQLTLGVDGNKAKRYPYTFCAAAGCFSRIGFTAADVATFKAGAKATLSIVPAAAPDEKVALTISLKGFTAGYDAVNAANGN